MTYVLDDVAVVADEEEGAAVGHVDLHADEAWRAVVSTSVLSVRRSACSEGPKFNSPSVCPGK